MVLTAVGPDRPGLVQELSAVIHGAGANLEDSRMAILGGEFALICCCFPAPAPVVERASPSGSSSFESRLGLRVALHETKRPSSGQSFLVYRLRVSGVDRPGIVASVSRVLAGRGINVASLESRLQHAPLTGTPMFLLHAEVQIPSDAILSSLREDLAAACDEDNLEWSLDPS